MIEPAIVAGNAATRVAAFHARGYPVAGYAGSIYEWSWWLRGMEQFLVDLLEQPDLAGALVAKVAGFTTRLVLATAAAGIDLLCFYTPIVRDVAELGFPVLHPVQPECMDPALIKERFGDRIVLCATLGAQHTLARGTPDEVAAETTRLMDTLGADRRCLVYTSNRIQPETPWENVLAFERAARTHRFGRRR
ncbi:MAG: hypothetical protein A2177_08285 [Spirochaetes bacterium RBG_13_68_11]|nr:MAG: hypothetical protein A2177_08285 [Spirochaetes bacterium RBG_13_68_11]